MAARVRRAGSQNFSAGASASSSRPKRSIGGPSYDSAVALPEMTTDGYKHLPKHMHANMQLFCSKQ